MATIGVTVSTGSIGPSGTKTIAYSNGFFVVQSPWGEDGVTKICDSFPAFIRQFGGLNGMASVASGTTNDTISVISTDSVVQGYYAVKGYFDEKGTNSPGVAYVTRVVKSSGGATAGTVTKNDGGANNTTFTAKWKGNFGNAVRLTITNPSPRRGTGFALIKVEAKVGATSVITEYWDLEGNAASAANISRKSELITVTLPAGLQLPATAAEGKINAGTPGTADSYNATAADIVGTVSAANVRTGLQAFNDSRLGSGFVAIPGQYSSTIRTGIATHVAAYDRMGYLGAPSGLLLSTVVADLSTQTGAQLAYFWPQLEIADSNSDSGGTLLIDPVGHVAGLSARMHRDYKGPHKSPAGTDHPFNSVLSVERQSNGDELVSDSGSNTLDDSLINTIRIKGNPKGIVQWGNTTLAQDGRYRQINASHTVNVVRQTCLLKLEKYVHEPIDPQGRLFARVKADMVEFLDALYRDGVFFGDRPEKDPKPTDAYVVVCDRSNNTDATVGLGELHVDIAIVPTPNAKQIIVNLMVAAPGFAR